MKKLLTLLVIAGTLNFGFINSSYAQNDEGAEPSTEMAEGDSATTNSQEEMEAAEEPVETPVATEESMESEEEMPVADPSFTQVLKTKFIEGGPGFMGIVLICLILGLAIVIERVIYLNMATTNTDKLLNSIEESLNSGGIDAAKEVLQKYSRTCCQHFLPGLGPKSRRY